MLQPAIQSCGFITDFVIDAAAEQVLPATCDALLECCQTPTSGAHPSCADSLDRLDQVHPDYRSGFCTNSTKQACGDASVASIDETDGGAEANSQRYGLCCYRTCGYLYCI